MKTTERTVPYVCKDCGHTQHQTEIVMPDGTFYVGGSANWCEKCNDGLPVRQAPKCANCLPAYDCTGGCQDPPQAAQPEPAFRGPVKWTPEEIADGYRGIRWVMKDGVYGRPTESDLRQWLAQNPLCQDTQPEHIGEIVVGEEGFTKGWTVVRWRKDLPPIPVGTKLYMGPVTGQPPAAPKRFTKAQRRRLYDDSFEVHLITFSIFCTVLDLVERAHNLEEP